MSRMIPREPRVMTNRTWRMLGYAGLAVAVAVTIGAALAA
jgi:hypothetical protein